MVIESLFIKTAVFDKVLAMVAGGKPKPCWQARPRVAAAP
jgi:hypothetical protein